MSRNINVAHKTTATKDRDDDDILEQGITQHHHHSHSKQSRSRFQAGDEDTEAPPIPRRHDSPQRRNNLQLAPAMEPGALDEAHAASHRVSVTNNIAQDSTHVAAASVPPTPVRQHTRTTTTQPGVIQVRGPGVHFFGRGGRPAEDQRNGMTPIPAEVVQETPLVMAVPAPEDEPPQFEPPETMDSWWAKRRNQVMVFGILSASIALIVLVTVLIRLGKDNGGGTSVQDATPPPTSPQTPTTLVPTTAPPTTASSPNTTTSSPTTQFPTAATTITPMTPTPTPEPTPMPTTEPPIARQWIQMGEDIDGEADSSNSGTCVSLSADGTTVAIVGNDSNVYSAVRVYELTGNDWIQVGNALGGGDSFGTPISLSADSTTLAISGDVVRVHQWEGDKWVQVGNGIDGEEAYDGSGSSVSLSADGTALAIGAPWNSGSGYEAGHVRVYQLTGNDWIQVGNDMDGEAAYDNSGISVSLSANGTTVAIGAYGNADNGYESGHVRVYQLTGNDWIQVGSDLDGEAPYDLSGGSVSLSADGTTVAIGALYNFGNGLNSGHARVYRLTGNDWVQMGNDMDGKSAGDLFGTSVSLSADGTTIAIGAPGVWNDETKTGYICIYEFSGDDWIQVGSDLDGEAVGDEFGGSVSLSADGSTVAVGAQYNDGTGTDAGHVRVYRLKEH